MKRWRLERLTRRKATAGLDPPTAFFVLAWDAFRAPAFAWGEAPRLARAVGVDPEREVAGRLAEKKGADLAAAAPVLDCPERHVDRNDRDSGHPRHRPARLTAGRRRGA